MKISLWSFFMDMRCSNEKCFNLWIPACLLVVEGPGYPISRIPYLKRREEPYKKGPLCLMGQGSKACFLFQKVLASWRNKKPRGKLYFTWDTYSSGSLSRPIQAFPSCSFYDKVPPGMFQGISDEDLLHFYLKGNNNYYLYVLHHDDSNSWMMPCAFNICMAGTN